jgi:SAM-dependent methyltransferase
MTIAKWAGLMALLGIGGGATFLYAAFGAFLPWREEAEVRELVSRLGVTSGQRVAEIGAGAGRFTVALAKGVGPRGRVFSTELDPAQRAAIAARAAGASLSNVTVIEGAPAATNLPDGCCDAIVMRAVYHHIQDPHAFAASVARAVRPGGSVAVIDFEPGALWFHGGAPDGVRRPGHGVSRADAIAEFQRAGFTVREEISKWSGPLWLVVFGR